MGAFKKDIDQSLSNRNVYEYKHLQNAFIPTLNKHTLIRKEILNFNNNNFRIAIIENSNDVLI